MAELLHSEPSSIQPRRMLDLPTDLHAAIARALAAAPAARWMRAAQDLSERYRAARADYDHALVTGEDQWLGYAALIMPATYTQLYGAMAAAAARIPRWAPATLLDIGSGPGTALWAAAAQWPMLRSVTAWEREPAGIALGRALARGSESAVVRTARWERVDLCAIDQQTESREPRTENRKPGPRATDHGPRTYDLVVLGHVLNELDVEVRRAVVDAAWRLTGGLLLIVEPGTPAGFTVARAARDALLGAGARTIAPCMHDRPCPLEADWCHFSQRLKRPDFQRRARGAASEWEDSKFAYAALARFAPETPAWGRIIREPFSNKAYAEVKISSIEGVSRYRALKRHRDAFRLVKRLEWGAVLDAPPPEEWRMKNEE